nr:hypothetical protein [Rheinheimera riviphila]
MRNIKFHTSLRHGFDFILPMSFIEICSKQITGVVVQQWIQTDDLLACQMTIDHLIGQLGELPVLAILAFYTGFMADPLHPFIRAILGAHLSGSHPVQNGSPAVLSLLQATA